MVVVLAGVNWFALKSELDRIVEEFTSAHSKLALEKIDCSEVEYNQVIGAIESLPFLTNRKMVVLYDLSKNPDAVEKLPEIIERSDDTTDVVIVEGKLDKRSVYYKSLKKLKGFHEFNELDEAKAVQWLEEQVKKESGTITRSDAQYFVQRIGLNQAMLSTELTKVLDYNSVITRDTINLLTSESPISTVFNLIDSAFSGNLAQAMRIYNEQRAQKVEPQAIHGMLVWQMHVVAMCVVAGNKPARELASEAKLNPFVVEKSQRIARKMGRVKIESFLSLLRDIDYKSKHQTYDYDEALRYAISTLASQ